MHVHALHVTRALRRAASAVALAALAGSALGAQEPERPRRWAGSAQANANVTFGNADQRVVGGVLSLTRRDSVVEFNGSLRGAYGDAALSGRGDEREREVTQRLWLATLSADLWPRAGWSPFLFATTESNYEKRIQLRASGGAGLKRTFLRTPRTEVSLSAAALGERTVPRDSTVSLPTEELARLSWRGRVRHAFDDRLRLSHVTFWQPAVKDFDRYLVNSSTELQYQATRRIALALTFLDNYDADAIRRGARRYNDGQVLFGVTAAW